MVAADTVVLEVGMIDIVMSMLLAKPEIHQIVILYQVFVVIIELVDIIYLIITTLALMELPSLIIKYFIRMTMM